LYICVFINGSNFIDNLEISQFEVESQWTTIKPKDFNSGSRNIQIY
jgi:hypothetical protein